MKRGLVVSTEYERGILKADVQLQRTNVTHTCVLLHSAVGEVQSLEQGDHVVIEATDDGLWLIVGILNTAEEIMPTAVNAKERVIAFDDGTEIAVTKDDSGGYDISISASADVTINATGDVTIGDSANAVELAVQNHTHDYEDTGDTSDGSAGTTTKTTSQPKESGTSTLVE